MVTFAFITLTTHHDCVTMASVSPIRYNWHYTYRLLQLGQPSVNPPRLVLEVGGTSTLQAAVPVKLKFPPLQGSKWGGTSALQAWLPAKLKSPPLQAQVRGGSRWADLAVEVILFRQNVTDFLSTIPFSSLHPQFVDVGLATFFVHLSCLCCLSISQV